MRASEKGMAPPVLAHPGARPIRSNLSRVGTAHRCVIPPSEPCLRVSSHTAQASRFRIRRFSCQGCCVDLLVAVEVHELQVGAFVRSALAFGSQVVAVEGFSVEQGSSAMATPSPLGACQAHEPGWQEIVVDLAPFALYPVGS